MKKIFANVGIILTLSFPYFSHAQTWKKISSNFDSLWTNSVKYFNKGDTIIYYGSTTGTSATSKKRFYVSTDGGYKFTRDNTTLDAIGLTPIIGLPMNNMIIGFQNTPNLGAYSFQSINNWSSLLPQGTGIYGEVSKGTILWNPGSGSTQLRTMSNTGANMTTVASGADGIDLICTYNKLGRLFLGGGTANIKYVDDGNFVAIKSSVISPAISGSSYDVVRFFESNNAMYAVINNGKDLLYKSTDNGATWNLQNTIYNNGSSTVNLQSSFIIGTPNGNIFFLETSTGTSDNVFLSKNGGVTAEKISNGLPSNGLKISLTIGKILTNGNKVWYQVCKANEVDFVRTDTTVAGLYLFNEDVVSALDKDIEDIGNAIYPNPTKDIMVVTKAGFLRVYNNQGVVVLEKQVDSNENINISSLKPALYYSKLNNDKLQKLIIE